MNIPLPRSPFAKKTRISSPRVSKPPVAIAMATQSIRIPNKQGHKLATLINYPDGDTGNSPVVVLCHGLMSSKESSNFPVLAKRLNALGLACARFDFSGNGESEGSFAYFNYNHEIEDIRSVVGHLRSQGRDVVMLVGHSKSGNNVLLYASKYDGDVPLIVNLAGRFHMKDGITDRFGEDIFKRLELERVVSIGGKDCTFEMMQERLAVDMYTACKSIKQSRVLTIHGTNDRVIPVEDARVIHGLIPGSFLEIIEDADHNFRPPHNEPLYGAVCSFVSSHLGLETAAMASAASVDGV